MNLPAYSGTLGSTMYDCAPARYGKGCVLRLDRVKTDANDIWKDRAAYLAEALGGRWARGHQQGYRIAPTRAAQWRTLFLAGWDAYVPLRFGREPRVPATFRLNDGPKLTLKEALEACAHAETLPH